MAKRMNAFKLSAAALNPVAMGNRLPMSPTTVLYVTQFRPQALKAAPLPPRRQIAIQIEEQSQASCVVKIIHADSI
jgi:hypothetical protein